MVIFEVFVTINNHINTHALWSSGNGCSFGPLRERRRNHFLMVF
jgi:hypothetical protein